MNNEKDILTIPLSEGGTLRVNQNNLDDLSKAIGMFAAGQSEGNDNGVKPPDVDFSMSSGIIFF